MLSFSFSICFVFSDKQKKQPRRLFNDDGEALNVNEPKYGFGVVVNVIVLFTSELGIAVGYFNCVGFTVTTLDYTTVCKFIM